MSNQGTKENSEQAEHSEQQDAHSEQQSAHSDSADSDAGVTFTPIFETGEAELSGDELTKSTYSNGVRWAIANNPSRPLEGNPTPFYRDTVEQVYDYWKAEFIEESNYKDTEGKKTEYTKFTFIVVDEQCLQSDPWEIIIACDAPDYGEAEDE
ncbi:MAG: hypothetical protein LQ338_008033, partial [Usnochroma carphineum]